MLYNINLCKGKSNKKRTRDEMEDISAELKQDDERTNFILMR